MFGGFEVNLLPELKHLHDAGYNIRHMICAITAKAAGKWGVLAVWGSWSVGMLLGLFVMPGVAKTWRR